MFEFTDPVIKRTDKKNNEKVQTLCSNNTDFGRVLVVMPSKNPDKTGVRIGTVRRKLFNHALTLDAYKDENGVALIGETSKVYINPRKNSYQMAYMGDSSEIMWGKFNNKRGAKKNSSIKICVGIGKIRSEGQIPIVDVPSDVDSDYSERLISNNLTEHSPEIHVLHTNKSRRKMTHDTSASGTTTTVAETLIRRACTNPLSELFHSLNKEMFIRTVSHFSLVRFEGKKYIFIIIFITSNICLFINTTGKALHEKFKCIPNNMSTWPSLSDLPSFATLPVPEIHKIAETGKYALGPEAAFPSKKNATGANAGSNRFHEIASSTKYLGDAIARSTSHLMNKDSKLPTTYKFTFLRLNMSTSTLLMETELEKKMKAVIGELSKTDVSGVFHVDPLTKSELVAGTKVWEIKIEGEETQIPKANFDAMSASSLFGLTKNNRVIISLEIVNRVAAPTDNYVW